MQSKFENLFKLNLVLKLNMGLNWNKYLSLWNLILIAILLLNIKGDPTSSEEVFHEDITLKKSSQVLNIINFY